MDFKNLNTQFLGRKKEEYDVLDSTQIYAKSLKSPDNGLVIIANSQKNGIGTHDRKWYTGENENLAMTFILTPRCNISKLTNLTKLISECMIKAIQNLYNIQLQIKLPNDIVYNEKKIGGVLTETSIEGEIVKVIYIGIGLNINEKEFPEELKDIASSLKKEFLGTYNKEDIIVEFFNIFEEEYLKIIK